MYSPVAQIPGSLAGFRSTLFLRAAVPVAALRPPVVAAWHAIDSGDAPPSVVAVADRVSAEAGPTRAYAFILGALAVVAFALALSGTASVVAYGVARRRSEFGLRMALGARGTTIVAMLLRGVLGLTCAGLAAGLALAAFSARMLVPQLYGVDAYDPFTYLLVGCVLLCATAGASLVPALRAAGAAPNASIRYE